MDIFNRTNLMSHFRRYILFERGCIIFPGRIRYKLYCFAIGSEHPLKRP